MSVATALGIKIIKVSPKLVELKLPITSAVQQPYGVVHGGINALLAEEAASLGANAVLQANQRTKEAAVGVDLNVNQLQAVSWGTLIAQAIPLHLGYRLQTWQVKIYEQDSQITTAFATLRLTSQTISQEKPSK
ncbi:PaaI family thioesterase [Convivina praedatoris]|uniref:Esterase n=1 Tax=Convivina praedatoris TaxID=2880963 RepID=A0ABM9D2A7_9LACO|nr:PaaI family thioesterase [Convivina sp. LMG 32447]CAH1853737.1 Putative esterase [Convivina sp. LMG 32447]CAH1854660.1 Putative esterase [Convivina sp. LMG 32447]CAH1855201.1 Putative esterase [Convivina sp. LMG 32447]